MKKEIFFVKGLQAKKGIVGREKWREMREKVEGQIEKGRGS